MIKVTKFGGSSCADSTQFKKVKNIILSDPSRKYVIVSACGKSNKDDHKVTDLLYLIHAHIKHGVNYDHLFKMIYDKYSQIKFDLNLKIDLDLEFKNLKENLNNNSDIDYIVSRGEYMTAKLMAEYLNAYFLDAKDCIYFNYDGSFNYPFIFDAINKVPTDKIIVIPGFYGSMPNGKIRVMSRGGSDITGSVISNVVNASIYENWTDVSGILVSDPRLVQSPKSILAINYDELRELSYMGANVIHDEAIFPIKVKNIPLNIKNTNDPDHPGTMILNNCDEYDLKQTPPVLTGISGRKGFTVISLTKSHISSEVGVLKKALEIVENYNLSIESVPTGIDSFSLVIETEKAKERIYELIHELKEKLELDSIKVEEDLALVAFVGRRLKNYKGFSGKLFGELGKNDINIRLISQTADEISIIVGINNNDYEKTINCIYDEFVR